MTEPPRSGAVGPATRIIRRAPTQAMPVAAVPPQETRWQADQPGYNSAGLPPSAAVPVTGCVIAIVSGWATSVVTTDLIASWWHTDRLYCVAIGFLSLVFAVTTVAGVVLLLRRRPIGRQLIAIGAVVSVLTFGSLFIAGARVPWIVHTVPVMQIISALMVLHSTTKRWLAGG